MSVEVLGSLIAQGMPADDAVSFAGLLHEDSPSCDRGNAVVFARGRSIAGE